MENFWEELKKKQEEYRKLSAAELAELPYYDLVDACIALTEKYDAFGNSDEFKKAPIACQNFLAIFMLDAQVNNGGFNQFFYNGYANLGIDYVKAHQDVGLHGIAEMVKEANDIYGKMMAEEKIAKRTGDLDADMQAFSDSYNDNPLNALDAGYYDADKEREEIVVKYIRENINAFLN
ncbi:MAG: DMP19 family protein [Firmicutes bacterium]|nr:DMP19 family protein [Bacillota bacterium]